MHIRVTPGQVQPGKLGEMVAIMRDIFAAYGQAGGFRGGYVAGDDGSGQGLVVTLWDDETAARAAVEAARPILARLASVTASGETPTPAPAYEVLLQV